MMSDSENDKKTTPWPFNPWLPFNIENPFYSSWPSGVSMTNNYNMPLSGSVEQSQSIASRVDNIEKVVQQLQANTRRIEANYDKISGNTKSITDALDSLISVSYIVQGLADNVLSPPPPEVALSDGEQVLLALGNPEEKDLLSKIRQTLDKALGSLFDNALKDDKDSERVSEEANEKYSTEDVLMLIGLIVSVLSDRVLLPPEKHLKLFEEALPEMELKNNSSAETVLKLLKQTLDELRASLQEATDKATNIEQPPTKDDLLEQLQQVKKDDYTTFKSLIQDLKSFSRDDLLAQLQRLKRENEKDFDALMRELK